MNGEINRPDNACCCSKNCRRLKGSEDLLECCSKTDSIKQVWLVSMILLTNKYQLNKIV